MPYWELAPKIHSICSPCLTTSLHKNSTAVFPNIHVILCHFQRTLQITASLLNAAVLLDSSTGSVNYSKQTLKGLSYRWTANLITIWLKYSSSSEGKEAENRSQNPARLRGRGDFLTSCCMSQAYLHNSVHWEVTYILPGSQETHRKLCNSKSDVWTTLTMCLSPSSWRHLAATSRTFTVFSIAYVYSVCMEGILLGQHIELPQMPATAATVQRDDSWGNNLSYYILQLCFFCCFFLFCFVLAFLSITTGPLKVEERKSGEKSISEVVTLYGKGYRHSSWSKCADLHMCQKLLLFLTTTDMLTS